MLAPVTKVRSRRVPGASYRCTEKHHRDVLVASAPGGADALQSLLRPADLRLRYATCTEATDRLKTQVRFFGGSDVVQLQQGAFCFLESGEGDVVLGEQSGRLGCRVCPGLQRLQVDL